MDIPKRIKALVKKHGSYRKAGAAIGVEYAYLNRLATGLRTNPSLDVLKKLGVIK